tara:strand:- start:115 stop:696 length:582 start_codon:yes stop_codon:yes gene_type:complete
MDYDYLLELSRSIVKVQPLELTTGELMDRQEWAEEFLDITENLLSLLPDNLNKATILGIVGMFKSENELAMLRVYSIAINNSLRDAGLSDDELTQLVKLIPSEICAMCDNDVPDDGISCVQCGNLHCDLHQNSTCFVCEEEVCTNCAMEYDEGRTFHEACTPVCKQCGRSLIEIEYRYRKHDFCSQDCLINHG